MFEHSIKVPRHYKLAANIVKKVSTEGGSVKSLLYDNKLRHFRTNVLYALITESIKHTAFIDKLFEFSELLNNEPRLDPWLAKVLTAELLFGKKSLPGQSKPEQTISSYKEQFEKYCSENQDDTTKEAVPRPRYVRINTNLLTTSDAIRAFQDEGYHFVRCTSGSYNDYLVQIQKLTEYEFTQDYHVKTVYVFPPGTKLHDHELYLENKIVLQDKATALAVHLLSPPPGSSALDMCAAPGMKTTQLAAYMRNEGKIYAIERNEDRYKTLCDMVSRTNSTCVETALRDSLDIRRGEFDDVEYILLDPSCSGSGMDFSVHSYIDPARLAKLTSLQEKFLKHAMNSFPKAKRIVYSTCSLFPEENERVVTNTVKVSRAKWRVQDVKELLKGNWNNFGSNMYGSIGERCLYSRPDSDFTTGFFLAVLDRDPKDFEKQQEREEGREGVEKERKKDKTNKVKNTADVENEESVANNTDEAKPKKKKSKVAEENSNETEILETAENNLHLITHDVSVKRKKSKKSKETSQDDVEIETQKVEDLKEKKKKCRKGLEQTSDNTEIANAENYVGQQKDIAECIESKKLSEMSEEIEIEQGANIKEKKKKRKKGVEETSDDTEIANAISLESEPSKEVKKKKKKDKRKHSESEIASDEIVEIEAPKKKRDKKN